MYEYAIVVIVATLLISGPKVSTVAFEPLMKAWVEIRLVLFSIVPHTFLKYTTAGGGGG